MILERFEIWSRTATASGRAEGVGLLARAILRGELDATGGDAVATLTAFLDDPSPLVRRALADAISDAPHAPQHLVLALAEDQPSIAAVVLSRSAVLLDAQLVDCAGTASPAAQAAIASRSKLSAAVAAALAEVGAPEALAALAGNLDARITPTTLRRMVERCGDHAVLREALLRRLDLPADVRLDLVAAATRALAGLVAECGWLASARMERIALEARDKATVQLAGDASTEQEIDLAGRLREGDRLTVGLALRALCSGGRRFFAAMLCELTGMSPARIETLLRNCGSSSFAALFGGAGLPEELLPVFRAAVRVAAPAPPAGRRGLCLDTVTRLLAATEALGDARLDPVLVMLRRFEVEAARDAARQLGEATAAARETAEPLLLADNGNAPARPSAAGTPHPIRPHPIRPHPIGQSDGRHRYTIDLAALEAHLCAA